MSASTESSTSESTQSSDPKLDAFVNFIVNRNGTTYEPIRRQGFVAFNRQAADLGMLQLECRERAGKQSVLCLTRSYRVYAGAPFGTMMAALVTDLLTILREPSGVPQDLFNIASTIQPHPFAHLRDSTTGQPLAILLEYEAQLKQEEGHLDGSSLTAFLRLLVEPSPIDIRLVLFLEVYGSDGDINALAEWRQAEELLFSHLPEQIGIVVSGVPEGYTIPTAPHFLEIALTEPSTDGALPAPAYRFTDSPFHSDRPTAEDDLDIHTYAEALARFILHDDTKPPLTVGIHGPWGKGKSSFMEMIDAALIDEATREDRTRIAYRNVKADMDAVLLQLYKGGLRRTRTRLGSMLFHRDLRRAYDKSARAWRKVVSAARKKVVSVRFNAWQFQDATQIWAGLAHTVSDSLERMLPWWRRIWLRIAYAWKRRRSELLLDLLIPFFLISALAAWIIITLIVPELSRASSSSNADDPLSAFLKVILPTGSLFLLLWGFAWRAFKVVQPVSERVASYMKLPDHKAQMGYQHRVMEDLRFVDLHLTLAYPQCKVVVYVDDLDRCSEEKIMEILQAINLILANCEFFVFLGMDTEMIHRAIRKHYKKDDKAEELPSDFSEHYLRKIIQISFHLPETPPGKLFDLTKRLFSEESRKHLEERIAQTGNDGEAPANGAPANATPAISNGADQSAAPATGLRFNLRGLKRPTSLKEVADTPDELEAFGDYQKFLKDNPREIKRLVNLHRLIKILIQQPGTQWSVERQRQLVKWLIFCSRWPDLVDDIIEKAKEIPNADDCLDLLIEDLSLTEEEKTRLKEFAGGKERLSSSICRDFTLAAQMSQMLKVSPAPRQKVV